MSDTPHADTRPDRTCRYAAGLPLRADRTLAEHDRRWLERRLRRQWLSVAAAVVTIAVVMLGASAMADHAPVLARSLHGSVGLGLVALGGLGVLGCLTARGLWRVLASLGAGVLAGALAARTWLPDAPVPDWLTAELLVGTTVLGLSYLGLALARRVMVLTATRTIRADLAEGRLQRFEAHEPTGPLDAMLGRLRAAGYLEAPIDRVRLEILPRSGLVVRLNGRRVERWEAAHVVDVAAAQPHALRVELPRGVAPTVPDPRLCLQRRSLTPQERAELDRHIAHLRRRWWPAALLTVLVLGLVAWDLQGSEPDAVFPLDGASLGWLALLVVVYVAYGRRVLAARKLEHDRRLRWVVTVHQDAADPDQDPPALEVLPISQLAWTERAAPAGWRLSRL